MTKFEVLPKDIPTKKRDVLYKGGEFKKHWICPYCFSKNYKKKILASDWRFNNFGDDLEHVKQHMEKCFKNPRHQAFDKANERELNRLFSAETKKIDMKFFMANGFYHKASSSPDMGWDDLCHVDRETDEAYIGAFVFGLGRFDVVFPKNKIRELTSKEVKEYHSKNIAISNNPPNASLNIKENKFDPPKHKS